MAALALSATLAPDAGSAEGTERSAGPAGIIVLGGMLDSYRPDAPPTPGRTDRLTEAVRLAREYPHALVVYTGREAPPGPRPVLAGAGIDGRRVVVEDRATSTAQNARFSADLLHPRPGERWLLVTNDWHMPRAAACFRTAGFRIEPHPVGGWEPDTQSIWGAHRELVGRIAYTVLGLCRA